MGELTEADWADLRREKIEQDVREAAEHEAEAWEREFQRMEIEWNNIELPTCSACGCDIYPYEGRSEDGTRHDDCEAE
jgi:hypothetical protein